MIPKKDSELTTIEELSQRIVSIDRQREEIGGKADRNTSAYYWQAANKKIAKLAERRETLWVRRAHLIRAQRGN